jgi:hypothetical protein
MKPKNRFLILFGWTLFFASAVVGMILFTGLTWANLEANFFFGYNGGAETHLHLKCPTILTLSDSGAITATITSKVDQVIHPNMFVQISGNPITVAHESPKINPGDTVLLQWPVGPDEVSFHHLIMAQVYQYSSYKTPTATDNCGTVFLYVTGLTGKQVYWIFLITSLAGMALGLALWLIGNGVLSELATERMWGMIFLAAVVIIGIFFGTIGQWIPGLLAVALAVLMFFVQVSRRLLPA